MINLNKKFLSKEALFKYVSDYEVYAQYIIDQEIVIGRNIYSPFRNELNPSFGFFFGEGNEICFHDFTLNLKGDCVKFVMILFDLDYFSALSQIAIDFNMEDDFICKTVKKSKFYKNEFQINTSRDKAIAKTLYKSKLLKKRRNWEPKDLLYWKQFGISLKTLIKYNVEAISHIFIDNKTIVCDELAYAFIEYKDNIETYKIYQPFSKDYKWINSHDNSIWQGWSQLPSNENPGILIITKSLKDVMAINENTDYNAVALQCENVLPKKHVIKQLEERFGIVIIFYDNDYDKEENWGQLFAKNLENETGFRSICIDEKYKSKDFTDLIKNTNIENASTILKKEINEPF